jgi:hypothetical protein
MKHLDSMMNEIDEMLTTIFGSAKAADTWWYEDNFVFGLKSPMVMWYKDRDVVYKSPVDVTSPILVM